jgi:FkbM family methyltransferase
MPGAVGASSGETMLYISDALNIDHRSYATEGAARRRLQVPMVALDHYFKPGERVDLLKIDIQRYEPQALERGQSASLTKTNISNCCSSCGRMD